MNRKTTIMGIGKKLREEGHDIVAANLPQRLAELLRQLEKMDSSPHSASRQGG